MFKISVFYPNKKDSRFDLPYYLEKHMPLAIGLLSAHPGYNGVSVERGLGGGVPGKEATYIVMCHFLFNSVENFLAAFEPNLATLQGDIPNYTDLEPVFQISEVVLDR
jgi:uncharacterized protein (TIGR02118 family)